MTEILTLVKIFWPQGLRCQSVERPDDQNRVNLLRQVRKILRERSRNLNREVWESPSVLRRRGCQGSLLIKIGGTGQSYFFLPPNRDQKPPLRSPSSFCPFWSGISVLELITLSSSRLLLITVASLGLVCQARLI